MVMPRRASVQPQPAPQHTPFLPATCSTWDGRQSLRIVRGGISIKCHWCRGVHFYSREEVERAWELLEMEGDRGE